MSSSAVQKEIESLQSINASLQDTIKSLDSISNNLQTLNSNLQNSNKLSSIYTSIHLHNRELNKLLQHISPELATSDISDLDEKLKSLQTQKDTLKRQLAELKK